MYVCVCACVCEYIAFGGCLKNVLSAHTIRGYTRFKAGKTCVRVLVCVCVRVRVRVRARACVCVCILSICNNARLTYVELLNDDTGVLVIKCKSAHCQCEGPLDFPM